MLADLMRRVSRRAPRPPVTSTIRTSTSGTATGRSNQRKMDSCQDGTLVALNVVSANRPSISYSKDGGATWVSTSNSGLPNWAEFSMFVDEDDYLHLVGGGRPTYFRGTPNASRTAWSFSAGLDLSTQVDRGLSDVVAHREGAGWVAHVVFTIDALSAVKCFHSRITILPGQALSVSTVQVSQTLPSSNTNRGYPSIDFHHTGNGKTVKDGTPHLYVGWSAGVTGSAGGIRFRKATYSSGSWAWGSEVQITPDLVITSDASWMNCIFDGNRVMLPCFIGGDLAIYERDAADTTTETRAQFNLAPSDYHLYGSATYDSRGNLYIFGRSDGAVAGSNALTFRKWTRGSSSVGPPVVLDAGVGDPFASAKRGHADDRIEFVYTDGTSSPYPVIFYGMDT